MNAEHTLREIEAVGLVPIVRTETQELALRAARAIVHGGIGVVEITLTVPNALEALRRLRHEFSEDIVLGAGSVRTASQARECLAAGAEFVVSPGLVPELVETVLTEGAVMVPGALTPTEVMMASQLGSQLVKLFPCSAVGGARYLRQLAAPLPNVKFLATGGVTLETVPAYVAAGATALGVGGELVDQAALLAGNDDELTRRARAFLGALEKARRDA